VTPIAYRPDVDGLRAVAVMAVLLYHYGIGPFHGGFVGVDVFFVISGYLITKIIHRQIGQGRFTFAGFYERRIRRIFPALFAVLTATLLAASFILLPSDLRALSNAALATLAFTSNVLFWRQSGYFDPSAELNPVLHMWSLAVEEQFYIVFPVFLIAVHRFAPRLLVPLLAIGAVVSFAACVALQAWQPAATFYLSPFRAWELALGGLLAVGQAPALTARWLREGVAALAFAVLAGSVLWTDPGVTIPGWHAAFPVVATAALIHTGASGRTAANRLLAAKPFVAIGLISYSLYLWHWPLIVFAKYLGGGELPPLAARLLLLAAAMALATASYRWIETPLRRPRREGEPRRGRLFAATALARVVAAIGALALRAGEPPWHRVPERVAALDAARQPPIPFEQCDGRGPTLAAGACTIGDPQNAPLTVLWGDSHAMAWAPAFADGRLGPVALALKSASPPLLSVSVNYGSGCAAFNDRTLAWIARQRPARVVMIAAWTDYSQADAFYELTDATGVTGNRAVFPQALRRTIERLAPLVGEVVVIGPTPGAPPEAPFRTAMADLRGAPWPKPVPRIEAAAKAADFWSDARRAGGANVRFIDPAPWFCDARSCRYSLAGALLYRDQAHLSVAGAMFAAPKLSAALNALHSPARAEHTAQ
jgi:peptidoglycan/LPS O-acetylase OafA/YrhL